MTILRLVVALCAALFLAACSGEKIWADDDAVARATFVKGPPPSITLLTTINDRSGSGSHSALLINGSQRVLFDPAGTWDHPASPERNDVRFGMTDKMVNFYLDYHARDTAKEKFHVIEQTLILPPQTAERILQAAMSHGAVAKSQCTHSISGILRHEPGLQTLPRTFFPKTLAKAFGTLPGVSERIVTEENDNPGEGHGTILVDKKGNRIN